MEPIIEVTGLGKKYNINHQRGGYITLRDVLANIVKHPFVFAKDKAKNAVGLAKKDEFWALKDVNFTVERGEVVGIIGANGAGKSTLLKILTGITPPTEGQAILRGHVSSLLEVGTGFNPELTGRENIFLNGAILGMTRAELAKKFDSIVEFAGVERFIDTPVKRYSSGMYVRLAFSVAAHLEPDILLVDEVLAVGDAEFQKKCLGKMEEVTATEGRTILFVSHNMSAIQSLCKKTIWIDKGQVREVGNTIDVVSEYMHTKSNEAAQATYELAMRDDAESGTIRFTDISITDTDGNRVIGSNTRLRITLAYESDFKKAVPDARVLITVTSNYSQRAVFRLDSHVTAQSLERELPPRGAIVCETEPIDIVEGNYTVDIEFLAQGIHREKLVMTSEFDVVTDNAQYNYVGNSDKKISERLIRYSFNYSK